MVGTELAVDFSGAIIDYGELCRLKYYKESFSGADYDNSYITASGSASWFKGLYFPVMDGSTDTGGDKKLLEQGSIVHNDLKLFAPPHINLSGPFIKIGLGSPVIGDYKVLPEGAVTYRVEGVDIYKKVYLRLLNTGSFIGEY